MSVRIFTTGGTFDKEYKILDGSLYFKKTHLPEIIKIGRVEVPVEVTTLMLMDSTEMTEVEREMTINNKKFIGSYQLSKGFQ